MKNVLSIIVISAILFAVLMSSVSGATNEPLQRFQSRVQLGKPLVSPSDLYLVDGNIYEIHNKEIGDLVAESWSFTLGETEVVSLYSKDLPHSKILRGQPTQVPVLLQQEVTGRFRSVIFEFTFVNYDEDTGEVLFNVNIIDYDDINH